MSKTLHSMVIVAKANHRQAVLALMNALGVDGGLSVELSSDGAYPVTHYGLHTWASEEFSQIMLGVRLPDPLPRGLAADVLKKKLEFALVSVDPEVDGLLLAKRAHFGHVLSGQGLKVVAPEIEEI